MKNIECRIYNRHIVATETTTEHRDKREEKNKRREWRTEKRKCRCEESRRENKTDNRDKMTIVTE